MNIQFGKEVREGLEAPKKYLSSKWFYNQEGDALYNKITTLHEYYLTRCEREILQTYSSQITQEILSNNKKKSFRNAKEIIEFLNERKRRHILELSYLDILKVILCCKNCLHQKLRRKNDLYKKSKSYVLDVMDITFIIQKIEELVI